KEEGLLIDWINITLKQEHIVVKSLEEDLFDGLILHHLLEKLGSLRLDVEKMALTEKKQKRKLAVILEAVAQCLQLEESQLKWSVDSIFQKDLLSTLYLLIAIAKHFQPDLPIPSNISVEVIIIEVIMALSFAAMGSQRSHKKFKKYSGRKVWCISLYKRYTFVFCVIHLLISRNLSFFADGVILLLLIGQLEGYFLNLREFFLNPNCATEMVVPAPKTVLKSIGADSVGALGWSTHGEKLVGAAHPPAAPRLPPPLAPAHLHLPRCHQSAFPPSLPMRQAWEGGSGGKQSGGA
uniref:Parvin gamma n=1 Tax=Chelydra serpentina TaxID=8475 RepID=A0A8C3XPB4_CHESE